MVAEAAALVAAMLELAEVEAQGERLASAELRALRAQISPHFIYNALAAVASFIHSRPEEARELLIEFAEFIRYGFARQRTYVTLADELRYVEKYLRLEQARFGERLRVRVQVDPEVLQAVVPVLSLQPLVENAVRHGVESRPEGGTVAIEGVDLGSDVELRVIDDGAGIEPERRPRARRGAAAGSASPTCTGGCAPRSARSTGWRSTGAARHDRGDDAAEVPRGGARGVSGLRVLAVDDERPALEDLVRMLRRVLGGGRGGVGVVGRGRPGRAGRRRADSTRCSSTCGCRGWTGWSWGACCGASSARRRSCSSPPTTTSRSPRSSWRRSTTSSSRCRGSGSTRRSSGWRGPRRSRRADVLDDDVLPVDALRGGGTRLLPRSSILVPAGARRLRAGLLRRGALPAARAARRAGGALGRPRLPARAPRVRGQPAARGRGAPAAERDGGAGDGRRRPRCRSPGGRSASCGGS